MASISTYITTKNPLFWESTIEATIRHALLFSDEVVVADGNSEDGSVEFIQSLQCEDDRIKLFQYDDDYMDGPCNN